MNNKEMPTERLSKNTHLLEYSTPIIKVYSEYLNLEKYNKMVDNYQKFINFELFGYDYIKYIFKVTFPISGKIKIEVKKLGDDNAFEYEYFLNSKLKMETIYEDIVNVLLYRLLSPAEIDLIHYYCMNSRKTE